MPEITPRTFKGTRDFLPEDMRIRDSIIATMKTIFTRYGFAPLETPALEFLEILAGKYGDEADKLLYPLSYKGGKELALRYDLTVPLARVIAMNPHLPKPFKRFQIQPVWRADSPQLKRGRYREFYQCDVDTVGSPDILADAEIIALMADVFDALKIGRFQVRINSRKILKGMITGSGFDPGAEQDVCRSIDKLDKEGLATVKSELSRKRYHKRNIGTLCELLKQRIVGQAGLDLVQSGVPESDALHEGLEEMRSIITILEEMEVPGEYTVFDFTLARGLDYYTGPIFEVSLPDNPAIGSVAGGGRYDDLVGMFMKEPVPAVGTSFGLERIHAIVKEQQEIPGTAQSDVDFLVCFFSTEMRADSLHILRQLHDAGRRAEMYFKPDKMKKQFSYADKKRIPYVIIYGPDEKAAGKITVKEMNTGRQETIDLSDFKFFKS